MTEISYSKLWAFLTSQGISEQAIDPTDDYFRLPDPDFIAGDFADWFANALNKTGFTYDEAVNDCENFAEFARVWAMRSHALSPGVKGSGSGLAFGLFWYVSGAGTNNPEGHVINVAVCSVDDQPALKFFEPQPTGAVWQKPLSEVKLTAEEIESCIEIWL